MEVVSEELEALQSIFAKEVTLDIDQRERKVVEFSLSGTRVLKIVITGESLYRTLVSCWQTATNNWSLNLP